MNFSAEESPKRTHETCQNELVVLGSVWTYGHPALSKDGGEAFISVAAEGKKESLEALFLHTLQQFILYALLTAGS